MAPDAYKWGFHDEARYLFRTERGLSRKVVEEIAGIKEEPQWMRDMRLRALEVFES
jgi:Fe-S cluster assembly protein SufB